MSPTGTQHNVWVKLGLVAAVSFMLMASCGRQAPLQSSENHTAKQDFAQNYPEQIRSADQRIDEYLRKASFNGTALVAYKGEVLLHRGYGMSDFELKKANTLNTQYLIGSMTKMFTAAAVLQLQERGLLNVQNQIGDYIPGLSFGERMTIHHLLTHTSGLPSDFVYYPDYSVKENVERNARTALISPPGSKFMYSNAGYYLLGYLIEKVSGESYGSYIQKQMLEPLHMANSGYRYDDARPLRLATGYAGDSERPRKSFGFRLDQAYAAGALYATAEDMYKWDRALSSGSLLNKDSLELMFRPYTPIGYGYGAMISGGVERTVSHTGQIPGEGISLIMRYVDKDAVVILLSNIDPGDVKPLERINERLKQIMFE